MWIYFVGLDLGQSRDFTALCIVEEQLHVGDSLAAGFGSNYPRGWYRPDQLTPWQVRQALKSSEPRPHKPELHVRELRRYPLGSRYTAIADDVARLLARRVLSERGVCLVIDRTGVGQGVFDMFLERELRPVGVTITGGNTAHRVRGGWNVPKRDLVGSAQARLQTGSLAIAASLSEAETLRRELENFKVKINLKTGHDSYEHWRESDHDDLVLSVALACWWRDTYNRNLDAGRLVRVSPQASLT